MPPLLRKGNKKRIHDRLKLATARHKLFLFPEGRISDPLVGFGFVADFSEEGVGLYLGSKLKLQTPVTVAFEDREAVTYRGTVMWANRVSLEQNFFGHEALNYRLGIKFIFGTEAERQRYYAYYAEVQQRVKSLTLGI